MIDLERSVVDNLVGRPFRKKSLLDQIICNVLFKWAIFLFVAFFAGKYFYAFAVNPMNELDESWTRDLSSQPITIVEDDGQKKMRNNNYKIQVAIPSEWKAETNIGKELLLCVNSKKGTGGEEGVESIDSVKLEVSRMEKSEEEEFDEWIDENVEGERTASEIIENGYRTETVEELDLAEGGEDLDTDEEEVQKTILVVNHFVEVGKKGVYRISCIATGDEDEGNEENAKKCEEDLVSTFGIFE